MQSDETQQQGLIEEARPLLEAEISTQAQHSYEELLAREGKLREWESVSPSGRRFSVCTQVIRPGDLECTLEVRASVFHLKGDEAVPLDLRACLQVTPDGQQTRV